MKTTRVTKAQLLSEIDTFTSLYLDTPTRLGGMTHKDKATLQIIHSNMAEASKYHLLYSATAAKFTNAEKDAWAVFGGAPLEWQRALLQERLANEIWLNIDYPCELLFASSVTMADYKRISLEYIRGTQKEA